MDHTDRPRTDMRRTVAPGQYLGFSLQASRLLDHLLRSGPGSTVSLEVLGDTSITATDGTTTVEELKSRTTADNPLSDRAVDFWKTIRNWVEAVASGTLDPASTRFRIYVTREVRGTLSSRLASASTREEARIALAEARVTLLEGESPVAAESELGRHLEVVFSADLDRLVDIVCNLELDFGSGRTWDDLRGTVDATFIPPDCAEDVLRGMSGWINQHVTDSIERREPATIRWSDFRSAVVTLVRRFDRTRMLASVASEPSPHERERELRLRTYVRQLELIDAEEDDRIGAVIDFLRAEVDRVEWARRGYVLQDSFDAFESELKAAWRNYRRRCDVAYSSQSEPDRGKILYSDCFAHRVKLEQSELPDHFCRGSFHKLADAVVIGWHPNFRGLLTSGEEDNGDDA